MKQVTVLLGITLLGFSLFACSGNAALPPATAVAAVTLAPTLTATAEATLVPTDTATPLPSDTATPTSTPTQTATPLPTYTPAPSETPSPLKLSIEEDFDAACNLRERENDYSMSKCEAGKYVIALKAGKGVQWVAHSTARPFDDLVIQVDTRLVSPNGFVGYGVLWRMARDGRSYYVFEITNEGGYRLMRLSGGKWTIIIPPTLSPAIRPNALNRVKAVAQGRQIAVYVNDQWLATVGDSTLDSGYVGLFLESEEPNARAEFDNLKVWRINEPISLPAAKPLPVPPTAPPAATPVSKYSLPAGKGGLVVRNWYGQDANFTIANTLYTVPANGETFIVLDPGTYPWSSNIPGIGISNGQSTIVAGVVKLMQFAARP